MAAFHRNAYDNSGSDTYLVYGVVLSLLLHVFLGLIFNSRIGTSSPAATVLEVSIIPNLRQAEPLSRQIVTPPERSSSSSAPSPDTKYLSDIDSTTPREQIKRGDSPDAGQVISKSREMPAAMNRSAQAATQPKDTYEKTKSSSSKVAPQAKEDARQNERSQQQPLKNLLLDDATLFDKFSQPAASAATKNKDPLSTTAPSSEPFSRPAGSGAAFIGLRGSSDYLPNLPDGDITLLNTKADKFAVFVRRVATNVFAQIRLTGWDRLSASDIHRIDEFATVHAVLDPRGNLIQVSIESSSGSSRFDQVLHAAVKAGARDANPPAAAKSEDGNFHFIFKSKSWSQGASNARTGAPFERRWLLLATGLL